MKRYWLLAFVLLAVCSCAEMQQPESGVAESVEADEPGLIAGEINVKVSAEFADRLFAATGEDGMVDLSKIGPADGILGSLEVKSMRRLFPYEEPYEERTREAGLNRWYVVGYGRHLKAVQAAERVAGSDDVEFVELRRKKRIVDNGLPYLVSPMSFGGVSASSAAVFNDPLLPRQWHYINDGSVYGGAAGCDINVAGVWKSKDKVSGSEDVIVAVIDEGVDFNHEDLSANMWVNGAEEGRGSCGRNFVDGSYVIRPGEHGTHVAGTIAAVNNNGKGVCGVAGGNAAKGRKGVKIMSCQIFQGNREGDGCAAIKWAADHGAVIAQNSWGYLDPINIRYDEWKSDREAIDYFISHAGNKNVSGGIVTFSAGNDNILRGIPAEYESCVSVVALGPGYRKASYSTYGEWASIAAPGGDYGSNIISTFPNDKYGGMIGTSMACPHVSGVAALMMSNAAKGTKASTIKAALLNPEKGTPIEKYNGEKYKGKLGKGGLVNAGLCVLGQTGKKPGVPTGFTVRWDKSNFIDYSIRVPADEDDGVPEYIYIYYSNSPITAVDTLPAKAINVSACKAEDEVSGRLSIPVFESDCYFAAQACDISGLKSALAAANPSKVHTGANTKPVLAVSGSLDIELLSCGKDTIHFTAFDADGHSMDDSVRVRVPELEATFMVQQFDETKKEMNGSFDIMIDALKADDNRTYTAWVILNDEYGAADSALLKYRILANRPPQKKMQIEDMIFNGKMEDSRVLRGADCFTDPDGEALSFTFSLSSEDVLNATSSKGNIYITPLSYGNCDVTVTATDARGLSTSQTFSVVVRDGSRPVEVYPNPVTDNFFIRTGEEENVDVRLENSLGVTVLEKKGITVSPFKPFLVSMAGYRPGVYVVSITTREDVKKLNVVKL
ncbi:MAG: S8 family serine peptidase [Bacteroidales bacterium]|nr:S8 family serine peptidase [Bacteroidales bacterium]